MEVDGEGEASEEVRVGVKDGGEGGVWSGEEDEGLEVGGDEAEDALESARDELFGVRGEVEGEGAEGLGGGAEDGFEELRGGGGEVDVEGMEAERRVWREF